MLQALYTRVQCIVLILQFESAGSIGVLHLQGRILVLETKPQQHKLQLVHEKETRGAVYTMSGFQVSPPYITLLISFANAFASCQSSTSMDNRCSVLPKTYPICLLSTVQAVLLMLLCSLLIGRPALLPNAPGLLVCYSAE